MTYTPIFDLTNILAASKDIISNYPEIPLIVTFAVGLGLAGWLIRLVRGRRRH